MRPVHFLPVHVERLGLFQGVPRAAIEPVLREGEILDLEDGELVLSPGDWNEAVHLVLSGEVRVKLGRGIGELPIVAGECFGEMSAIDGGETAAVVFAKGPDCRVLRIPRATFWGGLMTLPGVARNVLTTLVKRLRNANEMLLRDQQQRLAYERLQQDMQAAAEIQASMIPERGKLFPALPQVDCAGAMIPAVEVAGDFFDACMIWDDLLFFAVGDVSGKGVPAALFMAKTVPLLRMEASRLQSVPRLLTAVNDALCENNPGCMFVTLACGILDLASGELVYGNAGHVPPVLVRGGGAAPEFLDVAPDMVLGVIPGHEYSHRTVRLQPGDALLFYSDGVTEAFDARNDAYGKERLLDVLRAKGQAPAVDIVGAVHRDVAAFAAGARQSDDIALLAVRYLGPPSR